MWLKRLLVAVLVLAGLYGLGGVLEDNLIEYVVRIILLAGINATLAVGLNLINGSTGQFSIGHAGFMAVGAYASAFTVIRLEELLCAEQAGQLTFAQVLLVFPPALLAGGLAAALAGLLVGVPS